ncbi:MAG: N-acetyltransferase [Promethearchaeota archaeon]|nr:MAG: N-acetyltransferase [Candidatus Lokiarchaeota archaeon]
MKSNLNELYCLTEDQVKPASKILSEAFYDDPISVYLIPDVSERKAKLKYVYEYVIRYDILYGEVYATSPNLEGIAGWLHSENAYTTIERQIKSGGAKVISKLGMEFYKKSKHVQEFTDLIHKKNAPFKHWCLDQFGVDPNFQGKGFAGVLLKAMFTRVDPEGVPIYVETHKEKNVAIYQHYGFEILEDTMIPDTDIRKWAMLKEPSI